MVRVKICGLTRLEDASLAVELGAWALGFIFYPRSPRYISPEQVATLLEQLAKRGRHVERTVGVFVNTPAAEIREIVAQSGINTVQLHGDEKPEDLDQLEGLDIIKAFRLASEEQLESIRAYEKKSLALLFDSAVAGQYGGTGQLSNWDLLAKVRSQKPLIVSGGLAPDNVRAAVETLQAYAIDLSSGVEEAPGIKQHSKLKQLFQILGESHAFRT
jgi:phosphoribosylanthranilate isomerase